MKTVRSRRSNRKPRARSANGRVEHHPGRQRCASLGDAPGPAGSGARRGRGQVRRRVPRHRRALRGVRARPSHRHPPRRGRHRGGRHRDGDVRAAPGARDPVQRFHLSGLRSDRERAGQAPLPLGWAIFGAGGDPHAGRGRHQGRPLPFAVARGAFHPCRRAPDRLSEQSGGRQRALDLGDPRQRSRPVHGTQARLPGVAGRGARGRLHRPDRRRARRARGAQPDRSRLGRHAARGRAGLRAGVRAGSRPGADRPAHALAAGRRDGDAQRAQDGPLRHRAGGAAHRRVRRRDLCPAAGTLLHLAGGARPAHHRLGHPVSVHARERLPAASAYLP